MVIVMGCMANSLWCQSIFLGPLLKGGILRTFEVTGLENRDEIRPTFGVGGLLAFQHMYLSPELMTDLDNSLIQLGLGGRFLPWLGAGLKGGFLYDRFETVISDQVGNRIRMDESQWSFMIGGQLSILIPIGPEKQNMVVAQVDFSRQAAGLYLIGFGAAYLWPCGKSGKEQSDF